MLTDKDIIQKYISFFEKRGHMRIPNSPLVPKEDPTTLFTSSGMQPLVPYLLGEPHPQGPRLVNVQNCFRAQDIDEVGDNRHTTFFRMLGNWSLGDPASPDSSSQGGYFKKEQLPWFFKFLTDKDEGLGLDPQKLYVSVFEGNDDIPRDEESAKIWQELFESVGLDSKERIFYYGVDKNWWSRSGVPNNMPEGEPGGPDSEVFYDFKTPHNLKFGKACHPNCDCGRFLEIGNSVFMQYKKTKNGFSELPQKNVDFGGGLERLLASVENQPDIFKTNLLFPIIQTIEDQTGKKYSGDEQSMRIITDHFIAVVFMAAEQVVPSNKEQGYVMRRLIRRSYDHFHRLGGIEFLPILEQIVEQYKTTDPLLIEKFEIIKNTIFEELDKYTHSLIKAKIYLEKKYIGAKKIGDELLGIKEILTEDAFYLYTTHGLSPTQIKSLGYTFNDQEFSDKMKEHQNISRAGAEKKFKGGLADHEAKTIKGHTATHLLHQALRDVLGDSVHQTGSNITTERVRFDFAFDRKVTSQELKKVEDIVNAKIHENLLVHYEFMSKKEADELGALGLFEEKYGEKVKIYFIEGGPSTPLRQAQGRSLQQGSGQAKRPPSTSSGQAYSIEFCGGPHVDFTSEIKRFKIIKEEGLGKGVRRIYAVVG